MRIGELARQSGLPPTTLRYYEQAGLIATPRRTESGYRAYDSDALPRLAFIQAAQAVGLTLAEIRDVMAIRDGGRAPCRHVRELVDRRRVEVRSKIAELRRLEEHLNRVSTMAADLDPAQCDSSGICQAIPLDARHPTPTPVRRRD